MSFGFPDWKPFFNSISWSLFIFEDKQDEALRFDGWHHTSTFC